ncbi:PIN/TRAM domain-containing protein, partial [Patescibacteria group bacterium]
MAKKRKQKTEPERKVSLKEVKFVLRIVFGIAFAIIGFNVSKSTFFMELPLFGYHTILEVLISAAAAAFGFFILPFLLLKLRKWIEELIFNAVSNIVSTFWEQQSGRIQDARRDKQRKKAEEKTLKEKVELENAVILDTSVLVDGRLLDIVKIGFFDRPLVITENVLGELQKMADSKNKEKRSRGRRGLDIVKDLKRRTKVVMPEIKTKERGVDKQLVTYAKEKKLKLMTLDFNLNKVAKVSGIKVLNVNDLVNAL